VLARGKLIYLFFVAAGASRGRGHFCELDVVHGLMLRTMACRTVDAFFPHLALEVLLYDARRHFFVTLNAGALFRSSENRRAQKKNKTQYKQNPDILHADVPPFSDMIARASPKAGLFISLSIMLYRFMPIMEYSLEFYYSI
jgi:hypothetical protein